MGPLLLATNYGTFMIANIFVPYLKIQYKSQFLFGAVCFSINYVLEIPDLLNTFGIMLLIFGSILGGLGAAMVWIGQGGFMNILF